MDMEAENEARNGEGEGEEGSGIFLPRSKLDKVSVVKYAYSYGTKFVHNMLWNRTLSQTLTFCQRMHYQEPTHTRGAKL